MLLLLLTAAFMMCIFKIDFITIFYLLHLGYHIILSHICYIVLLVVLKHKRFFIYSLFFYLLKNQDSNHKVAQVNCYEKASQSRC